MDISEMEFLNQDKTFFAHEIAAAEDKVWMQQVADLCTENVFLTIDLDVFDPAYMPGTGTPEPGGLSYYQVLNLIKTVMKKSNIVGFDIVELCPDEKPGPSDFLAAKLYYKLLTYQFAGK
jgi:agmatinase